MIEFDTNKFNRFLKQAAAKIELCQKNAVFEIDPAASFHIFEDDLHKAMRTIPEINDFDIRICGGATQYRVNGLVWVRMIGFDLWQKLEFLVE